MRSYRDFCRRQHRILAQYLASQAFVRGLDCIVVDHVDLENFFGLERIKDARLKWLRQDVRQWFGHTQLFYASAAPNAMSSLFLSRVPISQYLPEGKMTLKERIEGMLAGAPRTETFDADGSQMPTEDDAATILNLLSTGRSVPKQAFAKRLVSRDEMTV